MMRTLLQWPWSPPRSMLEAVRPLYLLSQSTGLAPLSLSPSQASSSLVGVLYSTLCFLSMTAVSSYLVLRRTHSSKSVDPVLQLTYSTASGLKAVLCVISLAICVLPSRRRLCNILNRLDSADRKLLGDSSSSSAAHRTTQICALLVSLGVLLILVGWYSLIPSGVGAFELWIHLWKYLVMSLLVAQYSCLMVLLEARFSKVNAELNSIAKNCNQTAKRPTLHGKWRKDFGTITRFPFTDAAHCWLDKQYLLPICNLRRAYYDLIFVSSEANSFYGFQLLVLTAHLFFGIINMAYMVVLFQVNEVTKSPSGSNTSDIFYNIGLLLQKVALLFAVAIPVQRATAEAHLTRMLVVESTLLDDLPQETLQQLTLFAHQLQLSPMQQTARGFFQLDYSLLSSIVTSVVTYLVILVQLHN